MLQPKQNQFRSAILISVHTDTVKKTYLLASGLSNKTHKVQFFKRTEWAMGKTWFYGFETSAKTKLLQPPPLPNRKIEFYGNSITCGYAMEDSSGNDSWHGYFENNYMTYAALTARHFNAQYHCIGKSGVGIMLSWFPLIMPEMYDRLDAKFKHRFGKTAPDESFIIDSYKKFVQTIRSKYPNASIICALGNMDATRKGSAWTGYIEKAVAAINDPKIYTHFFEYKNTGGHPKTNEQQAMANSLIEFIDQKIKW